MALKEPQTEDRRWLRAAIEWARQCPSSDTAFSVGAIIVADGVEISQGFSRETDAHDHAEEAALAKLAPADPRLRRATIYSSLEPCSTRRSRRLTCTELIRAARIPRVVFALREPPLFVDCHGAEELRTSGVVVVELPEMAAGVRAVNSHLLSAIEQPAKEPEAG